jgi:hypothetical protein
MGRFDALTQLEEPLKKLTPSPVVSSSTPKKPLVRQTSSPTPQLVRDEPKPPEVNIPAIDPKHSKFTGLTSRNVICLEFSTNYGS